MAQDTFYLTLYCELALACSNTLLVTYRLCVTRLPLAFFSHQLLSQTAKLSLPTTIAVCFLPHALLFARPSSVQILWCMNDRLLSSLAVYLCLLPSAFFFKSFGSHITLSFLTLFWRACLHDSLPPSLI